MTFLAGEEATATRLNEEFGISVQGAGAGNGTITSTSYDTSRTGAASEAEALFVPPASGKVLVCWRCTMASNGANFTLCSYRIREGALIGSGDLVNEGGDALVIQLHGTNFQQLGQTALVTGLSQITHNIQLMYRTTAGTMTVGSPSVTVIPVT